MGVLTFEYHLKVVGQKGKASSHLSTCLQTGEERHGSPGLCMSSIHHQAAATAWLCIISKNVIMKSCWVQVDFYIMLKNISLMWSCDHEISVYIELSTCFKPSFSPDMMRLTPVITAFSHSWSSVIIWRSYNTHFLCRWQGFGMTSCNVAAIIASVILCTQSTCVQWGVGWGRADSRWERHFLHNT